MNKIKILTSVLSMTMMFEPKLLILKNNIKVTVIYIDKIAKTNFNYVEPPKNCPSLKVIFWTNN